jgi:heme exporter protein A
VQLVVENLVVLRGSRAVVVGLSFSAMSGEALVLAGANGSGKTTLLRALAGFLRAESGSIRLDGGDAGKSLAEQAHVVGHANAVKTHLTVRENIAFWASYFGASGADSAAAVAAALNQFGLGELEDFPAGYLSAGQKRRLGLCRLLVANRPLWLLDEPTVSLDAASTAVLADTINAHTKAGGIAIAATHLPLGLERARELRLGALVRAT